MFLKQFSSQNSEILHDARFYKIGIADHKWQDHLHIFGTPLVLTCLVSFKKIIWSNIPSWSDGWLRESWFFSDATTLNPPLMASFAITLVLYLPSWPWQPLRCLIRIATFPPTPMFLIPSVKSWPLANIEMSEIEASLKWGGLTKSKGFIASHVSVFENWLRINDRKKAITIKPNGSISKCQLICRLCKCCIAFGT